MSALLVAIGAALGACARYLTDATVRRRSASHWPVGTLLVNVVGSFALGLVAASTTGGAALLLGTGFCGALTTVSTFAWETFALVRERALLAAAAYVTLSVLLGVTAAWAGARVGG